jgi:hypothetical protein
MPSGGIRQPFRTVVVRDPRPSTRNAPGAAWAKLQQCAGRWVEYAHRMPGHSGVRGIPMAMLPAPLMPKMLCSLSPKPSRTSLGRHIVKLLHPANEVVRTIELRGEERVHEILRQPEPDDLRTLGARSGGLPLLSQTRPTLHWRMAGS